jgi:hypothetical protein
MSKQTTLSTGTVNGADLTIELVEPGDHPPVVRITWPAKQSIIPPSRFNAVAADLTRLIAAAATRLTQLRAQR